MEITYTWKVLQLGKFNSDSLSNIIVGVRWECKGTDTNGVYGKFFGSTPFKLNEVDPNNFVAYEDLTEEIVLNWIKGIAVGEYWEHIKSQISRQIIEKNNPVQIVSENELPWS